jgi:DNA polymerase-3 subunit alpha
VRAAVPLAARLNLPVVATHPVQFLEPDDFEAHEARVCIAEGETLANPRRVAASRPSSTSRRRPRWQALFADLPSALANTVEIARRCNLTLVLGKPQLPDFPTPLVDGMPMPRRVLPPGQSHEGLEERLALYPDPARARAASARATWSGWSSRSPPS